MTFLSATRLAAVALSFASLAGTASADAGGDIYSRLMDMKAMDRNQDSMISKQEFIDMVGRLWDAKTQEMQVKNGKLDAEQLKELERVLGRTLGAHSGA